MNKFVKSFTVPRNSEYISFPKNVSKRQSKLMPIPNGPKTNKPWGHTIKMLTSSTSFFSELHKKYGDAASFYLGNKLCIVLFDPEMINDFFTTGSKSFIRGKTMVKMRKMFGDSLLTSEDPNHIYQRRMMQPEFHKKEMEKYCSVIFNSIKDLSNSWENNVIQLYPEMSKLSLQIVSESFCGADVNTDQEKILHNFEIMIDRISKTTLIPPEKILLENTPMPWFNGYRRSAKILHGIAQELINSRKSGDNKEDLLQLLIDSEDLSDDEVRDQLLTIMGAGYETTAALLTWVIARLSVRPDILEKLKEEAENCLWLQENRPPTIKEIFNAEFAGKIIKETLRLSSPVWMTNRQANKDLYIKDVFIPKGTHVFVSQYVTHRMEEYYENPRNWNPERWTKEFEKNLPKGAYFPFGGGSKKCIGDNFAILVSTIYILMMAYNFNWENMDKKSDFPRINPMVTMRPKGSVPIYVKKDLAMI